MKRLRKTWFCTDDSLPVLVYSMVLWDLLHLETKLYQTYCPRPHFHWYQREVSIEFLCDNSPLTCHKCNSGGDSRFGYAINELRLLYWSDKDRLRLLMRAQYLLIHHSKQRKCAHTDSPLNRKSCQKSLLASEDTWDANVSPGSSKATFTVGNQFINVIFRLGT